ncbi:MAG TPA: 2'-5' RNA ligase family protein [Gaiellaceae bacterium]|nr:2'-5' RNA ligase family protein [Gaiellaceae bacterium]
MTGAGSVESDARVRLFCALTLPDDAVRSIVAWQGRLPDGDFRPVPPANLHVTLAFLGARPALELDAIGGELEASAAAARPIALAARRYRETRSVGMLVFDDEDGAAAALADDLASRLDRLGVYEPERRPWLPHLTVVRFRRSPRLAPAVPELRFVPSGAAVYLSRLRRSGAEYVVVQRFGLGGS